MFIRAICAQFGIVLEIMHRNFHKDQDIHKFVPDLFPGMPEKDRRKEELATVRVWLNLSLLMKNSFNFL